MLQKNKIKGFVKVIAPLALVIGFGIFIASLATTSRVSFTKASGKTYYVNTQGNDNNTGLRPDQSLATVQQGLALAQPGDRIELADGTYRQNIATVRSGASGAPITIHGGQNAIIMGQNDADRIVEIRHDFITLDGFRVDGHFRNTDTIDDYHEKLIYVIGSKPQKGVEGLKITHMLIENAGGECVRLRYFAKHNEISDSTIRNCGVRDFRFHDGHKNGEGIYIGTAPEQRADGKNPTKDVDSSSDNHIHNNIIETHGNECVDIKEGANHNLVERNTCRYQSDPESGGMDSRGEYNIFRYNTISDTVGAGVRLGGDEVSDGINNQVIGNAFINNQAGPLKILRFPQASICDNTVTNSGNTSRSSKIPDATRACNNN